MTVVMLVGQKQIPFTEDSKERLKGNLLLRRFFERKNHGTADVDRLKWNGQLDHQSVDHVLYE